jgi:lipopolysaccharide transport system ATP-binding protein
MTNHNIDYQNISSESAEELNHHSLNFSNVSIKVESLSKIYKLYNTPMDRLKETMHPFRKKYHKDFFALKDISFEVKKGETFGIIGKNGSGKSTLLKIITGVLSPSSGNVTVNGRVSSLLELGAGFNPELNGIENIYFYGTINGFSKEEMDSRLDSILAFADIGEFVFQPVKSYSSGMYVRLAFAVAIQVDPEILIIDEALSVGDIFFQQKCARRMSDLKEKGVTIIFVSHDMGSVLNLCNQVVYLKNGVVFGVGESSHYIREYYKEGGIETTVKESPEIIIEDSKKKDLEGIDKFLSHSIISSDAIDNEFAKVLAICIQDQDGNFTSSFTMGTEATFVLLLESKQSIKDVHASIAIQNKLDQTIFVGSSYLKQKNPFQLAKQRRYALHFNIKLNFESGIYTFLLDIGKMFPDKVNRGTTLIQTNKLGPFQILWEYEKDIPSFLGMFGPDYEIGLQ